MSKVIHSAACRGCEWYNDKAMDVNRECEALDHIFCEKALAEYETKLRQEIIDEVKTVINEITQMHIERYGSDIVELYAEVMTEVTEWLKEYNND